MPKPRAEAPVAPRQIDAVQSGKIDWMNEGPLFNEENIAALLGHLSEGSLAHHLVTGAATTTTRSDAKAELEKIVAARVGAVREQLDGDG
jgi:hypothetical protein